jgi:1-acyl-sn-glycerol-3-phosphate acyltransferase
MPNNKTIRPVFSKAYAFWLAFLFISFFISTYPLFVILLAKKSWYPKAHALRRVWGSYIFYFGGMECQVEFEEKLTPNKTYIFVPNHSSYLDIPAFTVMMPGYFIFMAKAELLKVPLFRIFFKTIDIPVNRQSAIKAHRSLLEANKRLSEGISIVNFPEGTIPQSAPTLGRFKEGPFRLAIENEVDLVPITLPDNHLRLPDKGKLEATPGKVRMFVHKPISTKGLLIADANRLKQEVYCIIEAKLAEYAHNR